MSEPQSNWRGIAVRDVVEQPPPIDRVDPVAVSSDPLVPSSDAVAGEPTWRGQAIRESERAPTVSERVGAFGSQAGGAAISGGAIASGMVAGAGIGTLGGPAAPVTVPLGAVLGAGAGYLFGEGAKANLGIPKVEALPSGLRPYGYAGEFLGGGLAPAAAPLVAARLGARLPPSMVGKFLNRIVDMAAKAPGTFAVSEAGGLIVGGVAGGVAEEYAPGNAAVRIPAEIAGGFLSPSRWIPYLAKGTLDFGKQALRSLSPAARETEAGRIIQDIVKQSGEDPVLLARLLRAHGFGDELDVGLTSAQKTGSPALAAFEAKLAGEDARFGADAEKSANAALKSITDMLVVLRGTGDPAALVEAGKLQQLRFRTLLASRVDRAEREALDAASRISADTPAAKSELSRVANAALDNAMSESRAVETELWEAVRKDVPAATTMIVKKLGEIRAGMLAREVLPDIAEGTVNDFVAAGGRSTSGELILFRGRMLALARQAGGQGSTNDARIYGELAEAALDDLDRMAAHPAFGAFGKVADGYNEARTFSREFNDVFTRTFTGKALASDTKGASRIPPELMLKRALATGEEAGALRFKELEEATRFLPARSLGGPEAADNVETMLDAQQRVLRLAAAEAIDQNTGQVSPTRLAKIIYDNGELLDRFPAAKNDLVSALTAQNKLDDIDRIAKGISRVADQQAAFARVAKFENASDAVKSAIAPGAKAPLEEMDNMVKVAQRGGPDAVEGLRAAIWEHSIRSATGPDGAIDMARIGQELFKPIRPGQPSLMDIMTNSGAMTPEARTQTEILLTEAIKIVEVMGARPTTEAMESLSGGLADLVIRITGARFGSALGAGGGSGNSLIAAAAGVKAAKNVFNNVPWAKTMDLLVEAGRDPLFMAMLLEKPPRAAAESIQLMGQIHAYLFSAGLTALDDN